MLLLVPMHRQSQLLQMDMGLFLLFQPLSRAIYLGSWVTAVCMFAVVILIILQLFQDINEENSNHH